MTLKAGRLMDTVDEMLHEAGEEQDTELRAALLSLGSLGSLPAPPPNAQLAALLGTRPDKLSLRRRLRRHRPAVVGLAVVAGMGLGVTGVAASASRPAEQASASVQQLLEDWAPSWNVSGLPAAAPAIGLLPEAAPGEKGAAADSGTADGQREFPVRGSAGQHARPGSSAAPGGAGKYDAGPGTRDAPGSAGGAEERADKESKVPPEAGTLPGSAPEAARQALEEAGKRLSGAVPGHAVRENAVSENAVPREPGKLSATKSGTGKKPDPGAKWLKKFSR